MLLPRLPSYCSHTGRDHADSRLDSKRLRLIFSSLMPCLRLKAACRLLIPVVLVLSGCRRPEPAGPIHFAREEVALDIRPGTLEVRGTYHFTCSAPGPLIAGIFYPFPTDSNQLYPDSIEIHGQRFSESDSGVFFRKKFVPGAGDSFFAYYRQPLRAGSARYIITSTRKWHRPIDLARFRVTVPASFQDVKLSFRPDSSAKTDSTITYYFTRARFYPDRDLVVTWRWPSVQ